MSKIFGEDPDALAALGSPVAAVHRRADTRAEFRKPRHVQRMAERANQLMEIFAKGGSKAVYAALTPQELARRADEERILGAPEKVLSDEDFDRLSRAIDASGPVINEEEAARRAAVPSVVVNLHGAGGDRALTKLIYMCCFGDSINGHSEGCPGAKP